MALLAMRTAINDTGVSPSLVIYGEQLSIPHAILDPNAYQYDEDLPHFVNQLFANIRLIRDKLLHIPVADHVDPNYVFPTEYAFMREPQIRASLEPKWLGPFPVVDVMYPLIRLRVDDQERNVNIDLVKPAYILQQHDNQSDSSLIDSHVSERSPLLSLNPVDPYADLYQEICSQPGPQVTLDPISEDFISTY